MYPRTILFCQPRVHEASLEWEQNALSQLGDGSNRRVTLILESDYRDIERLIFQSRVSGICSGLSTVVMGICSYFVSPDFGVQTVATMLTLSEGERSIKYLSKASEAETRIATKTR